MKKNCRFAAKEEGGILRLRRKEKKENKNRKQSGAAWRKWGQKCAAKELRSSTCAKPLAQNRKEKSNQNVCRKAAKKKGAKKERAKGAIYFIASQ
jgi:hypothetical protein